MDLNLIVSGYIEASNEPRVERYKDEQDMIRVSDDLWFLRKGSKLQAFLKYLSSAGCKCRGKDHWASSCTLFHVISQIFCPTVRTDTMIPILLKIKLMFGEVKWLIWFVCGRDYTRTFVSWVSKSKSTYFLCSVISIAVGWILASGGIRDWSLHL